MNRTSVAPDVSESLEASGLRRRPSLLTSKVSIAILVVVYLAFALTFSLLTRAWEADDEVPHTQYIEYIVAHNSIPHISARNNIESHQPPLYYLVAATWQRIIGIPEFAPDFVPAHYKDPFITGRLVGRHDYTPTERRNAIRVHEIRLLSIVLGLGTVLLTYAARAIGESGRTHCPRGRLVRWPIAEGACRFVGDNQRCTGYPALFFGARAVPDG